MYRSNLELRTDILDRIKNGVRVPSKIGYSVGCNYRQLRMFLRDFESRGLVDSTVLAESECRVMRRYQITAKGEALLRYMLKIRHLISSEKNLVLFTDDSDNIFSEKKQDT